MNIEQSMAMAANYPSSRVMQAAGKCSCRGACGTHTGPCSNKVKGGAKMCATCKGLQAEAGAPKETSTRVQAPSDLARMKGVLPLGKWIGHTSDDTTVSLPTAQALSMAKIRDGDGDIDIELPSDVAKRMSKPAAPGQRMVAMSAGGPGSGRRPGYSTDLSQDLKDEVKEHNKAAAYHSKKALATASKDTVLSNLHNKAASHAEKAAVAYSKGKESSGDTHSVRMQDTEEKIRDRERYGSGWKS